jgi:HD-GYP domain-containing protein (c-di-GMP phosphodiesterase class II)
MGATQAIEGGPDHPAMVLLGPCPEVAAHGRAVARTSVTIGAALGLNGREREALGMAAGLHDLGKIPIPKTTLDKPGPLDPDEWAQIRLHPVVGQQLLISAGLERIAPWVRAHHERPDGSGYPDGLKGDDIPLQSRIIAVADAFDAMVSDRPYRSALGVACAREELVRGSGSQFDGRVVGAFLGLDGMRRWRRRFEPARAHAMG